MYSSNNTVLHFSYFLFTDKQSWDYPIKIKISVATIRNKMNCGIGFLRYAYTTEMYFHFTSHKEIEKVNLLRQFYAKLRGLDSQLNNNIYFLKYPGFKMGASPRVNFWGTNFQSLFKFDTIVIDNIIFKLHHQVYFILWVSVCKPLLCNVTHS